VALRLVDIYRSDDEPTLELPDDTYDVLGHWSYAIDDDMRVERVLLEVEETEAFLDWVDGIIASKYRVVLQSVEATLPRPEMEEEDETASKKDVSVERIGRNELYEYARGATDVSGVYYALVALSMIVAAGGMLRNQTAVVIGAMMIAPLLGPSLALSLGTTLGDLPLLGRALRANVLGMMLALSGAFGIGLMLPVNPETVEIAGRTVIGLPDVVLAGAAGAAGALSVTRDQTMGLVGVMVAVALLPPLVAFGLLLGGGYFDPALQAGLLTLTNVVALNLAAVCTFLVLGVRPRDWRDVEQARTSVRIALGLWGGALILLLGILWWIG
jgi:uncharacterized hydrophobic protein (TIGR00341 family)